MRTFITVFLFVIGTSMSAQVAKTWDGVIENLKTSAETYLTSYTQKDWDTYKTYLHSNVTEMAGGDEMMIKLAEESVEMYKGLGFDFKSIEVAADEIESVDSGEGIQAIVPAKIKMEAGDQKLESPIKLFAISSDGGELWKFVDLSQYSLDNINLFVPEFSSDLKAFWD